MPINMEYRTKKVAAAKIGSAAEFGGVWYKRTTYEVSETKHKREGYIRMLDVVGGVCVADYYWKKGTAHIETHEPNTSYWGNEIGAGTAKMLGLRSGTVVYIRIGESQLMLEKPKEGRDYGEKSNSGY